MSHVKFEHIKGITDILADYMLTLKTMDLYDSLASEEHAHEFGTVF